MRRDQLEHAIRTACQIIGHREIIIVGSQAILGSFDEHELPSTATMSQEIDALPIADTNREVADLADQIEGVAGEWSAFEEQHGFSIDGVDLTTSILPAGWRDRLVKVQNENTAAPSGDPRFTGWCLDPEDLCVSKLCAFREKDVNFVRALLSAGLVSAELIIERLGTVSPDRTAVAERAVPWVTATADAEADAYTFRTAWVSEDVAFVATCDEFSSLSWVDRTPEDAVAGLKEMVVDVLADMRRAGEPVPKADD